jgi:hypothetical protein
LLSEAPEGASLALLGADLLAPLFDRPQRGPRYSDTAQIAVGCVALLDADTTDPRIDAFVALLTESLGIPAEEAADVPITGTPTQGRQAVRGLRRCRTRHGSSSPRPATTSMPSGS